MTSNRLARAILGIIFVALLVAPLVLKRLSARRTGKYGSTGAREIFARREVAMLDAAGWPKKGTNALFLSVKR